MESREEGSLFDSSSFGPTGPLRNSECSKSSKGFRIEELNSDGEEEDEKGNKIDLSEAKAAYEPQKVFGSSMKPYVEHPDDHEDASKMNNLQYRSDHNKVARTHPQAQTFSFKKVTYGGVDGAYYTVSTSRKEGGDGVVLEENTEANMTTGEAAHRISRGIHEKGHSLTRRLGSDGLVDSVHTLHNLDQDELSVFEEAWKHNAQKHLPGGKGGFREEGKHGFENNRKNGHAVWDGWALPSVHQEKARSETTFGMTSPDGGAKKIVRINID